MYKKGGKKPKSKNSFMEESKEIKFGDKPSKKGYGGMMKYKKGGMPDLTGDGKVTFADVLKGRGVEMKKNGGLYSAAEQAENIAKTKKMNSMQSMDHQTQVKKKTGGKSMEPGGGGRFAAMVSKLKGEGKSEGSAKAIAASIGRKKYGKSKFQEMAAKGKKGLGGMSDSTGANEAGMEMMEAMGPKRPKKGSSGTRDTGPNVKRTKKARKQIGKCNRGEVCFD